MLKINYPSLKLKSFKKDYYDSIRSKLNVFNIEDILKKSTGTQFSLFDILASSISDLVDLKRDLEIHLDPSDMINLESYFNYDDFQPTIAYFFSTQSDLALESCFYCNMDFIHSFKDFGDYIDGLDFLDRAHEYELLTVPYITEKKIKKLKAQGLFNRPFKDVSVLNLNKKTKDWLDNFPTEKNKNHFTLDHVLPKSKYKLLSLSLFNFVPCCFACNSKFKKAKEFKTEAEVLKASPSSDTFSIHKDFEFYLYFEGKLEDLKETSKINLAERILSNESLVHEYFKMFKIPGRYMIHKKEALRLIRLKNRYPESKLKEIQKLTGEKPIEVMKDLFGDEIFDLKESSKSLVKFKRDIAKNIKINPPK